MLYCRKPGIGRASVLSCLLLLAGGVAWAQGAHDVGPPPDAVTFAQKAKRRFPQPVRVGDLTDRQVVEPSNHQHVLGRVDHVVRTGDGTLVLVMRYGGLLGFATRKIAVPIDAMTLVGTFMQIVDIPRSDLPGFPTFDAAGTTTLQPDEVIKVAINRN